MKTFKVLMMAVLIILSVSVFAQNSTLQKNKNKETVEVTYVCLMHPDVIADKSGKCPKCGRNLTPKEKMKMEAMKIYTCPMHSDVTSNKPGKCPKCGMGMKEKNK
ncbi:heavy metal-binding domain-containing protein [Hydrotalea sp.]|uniref:heavy metal-binding domain-containing protein n=1 Tax=Hydrotalea sp. TaxID=2881279 RepID=UPI00262AAF02|nr:heavy metal-binding domain-containing protein [Hydrotalea sp.]